MTSVHHALLAAALIALALAGCTDDTSSEQPPEVAQYCALSAELDAQEEPPSEEQLEQIEVVAPPEIADDVATLVEAVRTQDFSDPDVEAAERSLLAWEEANCPDAGETEGPAADGATETATP